jgi:hypothetical protein
MRTCGPTVSNNPDVEFFHDSRQSQVASRLSWLCNRLRDHAKYKTYFSSYSSSYVFLVLDLILWMEKQAEDEEEKEDEEDLDATNLLIVRLSYRQA